MAPVGARHFDVERPASCRPPKAAKRQVTRNHENAQHQSPFAGKRDELIEEAGGAAQAGEAEGGVSAADESEQFAGDVGGQGARGAGAFGAI